MRINIKTKQKHINLLDWLREREHYIPAYCGGKGICGKCKVRFVCNPPEPTENEKKFFSPEELEEGWRLACVTEVAGEGQIELPMAGEEEIEVETGFRGLEEDNPKKASESAVPVTELTSTETTDQDNQDHFVVAVDIGTTTLAASLVDQKTKKVIKTVTSVNHQRMYGADVISRIEAANRGEGEELQKLILNDLEDLLQKLEEPMEVQRKEPMKAHREESLEEPTKRIQLIISGNTTMEHLLQGYSCKTLGVAPYTPVDISLHEYKNMTILPGISTYVGADIVSGIVACGMNRSEKVSILVDVGTNGEMAIGNKDRILVASTAAGPAFEGGNIKCGVAGVPGAIASVNIENDKINLKTIGDKEPIGICGSGVVEITYELKKNKIIDETGLMIDAYFDDGYPLGNNIVFTQKDIREFQMAKAAIRAGIEVLIREYGIAYDEIENLYLAGGFGQHINVKKAVGIGLLPRELEEKIVAVGNTSLNGAVLFAIDDKVQKEFVEVEKKTREISLAEHDAFQDLFMEAMFT